MTFATIDDMKDRRMAASRTVRGIDDTYDETLKRFSGIPADLVKLAAATAKDKSAQEGRRVKRGQVYGEILTSYMNAVEAGEETPAVLPKAKGDKASEVSVWIRSEITERFAAFVSGLEYGNESEVLSAALRWQFNKQR